MYGCHFLNRYSVCIRSEYGFCCVQYQVCPDGVFELSAADFTDNSGVGTAATDDDCVSGDTIVHHDYLAIPNSGECGDLM